ncbi:MAG: hypothetical protein AMS26_20130 [Bacteroides sp. SM23_62]|nr:MAG: hypothetical protein AMS26_20130 [Bacteroides sp. SM23_62]
MADTPDKLVTENAYSGNHSLLLIHEKRYGQAIKFDDINEFSYITSTVWYYGEDGDAHIVASCGSKFYYVSSLTEERNDAGWNKQELGFWLPQKGNNSDFIIYLWNSSKNNPVLFDDFQIIRRFK